MRGPTTTQCFSMRCLATIGWHGSSPSIFFLFFFFCYFPTRRRDISAAGRGRGRKSHNSILLYVHGIEMYGYISPISCIYVVYVQAYETTRPPPQPFLPPHTFLPPIVHHWSVDSRDSLLILVYADSRGDTAYRVGYPPGIMLFTRKNGARTPTGDDGNLLNLNFVFLRQFFFTESMAKSFRLFRIFSVSYVVILVRTPYGHRPSPSRRTSRTSAVMPLPPR